MPLPLKSNVWRIELIVLHRIDNRVARRLRLLVGSDRLAFLTHDRPTTGPVNGVQMNYAAVSLFVLEMYEPVFTIFRMHPATLMRTIDIRLALCQYDLVLVGTIRRFRTHRQLEARRYTASRTHDPVPTIALIELRTLAGAILSTITIENDDRLSDRFQTIG